MAPEFDEALGDLVSQRSITDAGPAIVKILINALQKWYAKAKSKPGSLSVPPQLLIILPALYTSQSIKRLYTRLRTYVNEATCKVSTLRESLAKFNRAWDAIEIGRAQV